MPVEDGAFSLVIALSVFTHTTQAHAEHYLREVTRVMRVDGMLATSFFLFEKRYFLMMHDFQSARTTRRERFSVAAYTCGGSRPESLSCRCPKTSAL
jgi:hypothetical protein